MRIARVLAIACCLTCSMPSIAAYKTRPTIGVVMSGGGARGYAHIGILKYLEEHRIPVDYIAATSVGALVGGLYASGMSAHELEQRLSSLNLDNITFDRKSRSLLYQTSREDDYRYPIKLPLGYGNGAFRMPSAFIQGTELLMLFQDWTSRIPSDIHFDMLPTPFRAIASDLANGNEIILSKGNLPDSMRASMAVPGLFTPVSINGRTLIDGGISSNLPIKETLAMGADIIIAVDIGTTLKDINDIKSTLEIIQQSMTIMVHKTVQLQKSSLRQRDILITPDTSAQGFLDFSQADVGINKGHVAASKHAEALSRLSLSKDEWHRYRKSRQERLAKIALPTTILIDEVRITTSGDDIPVQLIRDRLNIKRQDTYDVAALNARLLDLADNLDVSKITHAIETKDGRHLLHIHAASKDWGPHFIHFGLGYSNYLNGEGNFTLRAGHRYRWHDMGTQWRNDLLLGTTQAGFSTELRQPLWQFLQSDLYLAPFMSVDRDINDYYSDHMDTNNHIDDAVGLRERFTRNKTRIGLNLGISLSHKGDLKLGLAYQDIREPLMYNDKLLPKSKFAQTLIGAKVILDQLDDAMYPRHGYQLSITAEKTLGHQSDAYLKYDIKGLIARSVEQHTLTLLLENGRTSSKHDRLSTMFTLGGPQRMPAYPANRFAANRMAYGEINYRYHLQKMLIPGLQSNVAGMSLEMGKVWHDKAHYKSNPFRYVLSTFVGGQSMIGPVHMGAATTFSGEWNVYVQIGIPF